MQTEIESLLRRSLPGVTLQARQWARLLPLCRVKRLARQAVLLAQGQPTPALFGLLSGELAAQFNGLDGQVSVVERILPGKLFGLSSFASGLPSTFEAMATRPARVVAFGPGAYAYLMDEIPGFARSLLTEFARRHHGALRLLESARHRTPMERLGLALEQLAASDPAAPVDPDGWRFVRSTQADLAALVHVSRQTVNGLLATLARQGRLRLAYGGLWLPGASWQHRPDVSCDA